MSKIGKKPVRFPSNVSLTLDGQLIRFKGILGETSLLVDSTFTLSLSESEISLTPENIDKNVKMKWGLYRSLIANKVQGVSKGFNKELELVGIGYRVQKKSNTLVFSLGYSHPVDFEIENGINCEVKGSKIQVNGIDKNKVGDFCEKICKLRKQDPYKGKGIYIVGLRRRKKQGKK
eukprot:COSAG01_NODE_1_length_100484_cov_170.446142_76_plen_176_part_00